MKWLHFSNSIKRIGMLTFVFLWVVPSIDADDSSLFTANVPPNVMLLIDNSGSMNNVVWHEAFDPSEDPDCNYYSNNETYYFNNTFTRTRCGNTRTLYVDSELDEWTWISGRYLNWFFSDASDDYADFGSDGLYGLDNGITSDCLIGEGQPATYSKYRRSRITAAKQVLREVICQVNAVGDVRFGLSEFFEGGDPRGGYIKVGIDDYDAVQGALLDESIDELEGTTWTPLGETLYNVYRYFQSRTNPMLGKDGVTEFPWYNMRLSGSTTSNPSNTPPSPAIYACQKNFVIVITDGEPTRDDFDGMDRSRFQDDLIGDYNPDNDDPEGGNEITGGGYETAWYLDDIAKFMQENDFQYDLEGTQVIDTYTVGFTTSPDANAILSKAAAVGNGLFFYSTNAEELAEAIVAALTDIIEKSQSFTAATVPASRATDGNNFYTSYFIPGSGGAFWEGHIKNFEFTASGEIQDALGDCAVDDPLAPARCLTGVLRTNAPSFWDAADELPTSLTRNLYASNYASGPPASTPVLPPLFSPSVIGSSDLVGSGEALGTSPYSIGDFPDSGIASNEDLADRIVEYLAGCEWDSAPCVDRDKRLWDVFHSNPLLVGSPNSGLSDVSYRQFADKYRYRKRVLYAGSNGGFMHGFNAGEWDAGLTPPRFDRGTGIEEMGFMAYPARQNAKELAKDEVSPKFYFMDGSPQAADVWFYPTPTSVPSHADEWHTILLGNMRQGGNVIWALDVTDPPDASHPEGLNATLPYPGYLWEFPCEATGDSRCSGSGAYPYADYMGETWSDPIVTRIRVNLGGDDNSGAGYERWVAIVAGGYSEEGDPNRPSSYDASSDASTSREGRAVFIIDIKTGDLIAMKRFSHDANQGDPRMQFALAATPAVFDLNFDGYADVIYLGDLGGNLWKWVISNPAELPASGGVIADSNLDQSAWSWIRLVEVDHCEFDAASPSVCPVDHYRSIFFPPTGALIRGTLWLAFGTGERNQLDFAGYPEGTQENNRFYVLKDLDPWEKSSSSTPTEARHNDFSGSVDFVPVDLATTCDYPAAPEVGFYIEATDGEKFITNSSIFFGDVYTLSFLPDGNSDPCASGGDSRLYGFDLRCAEGAFSTDSGETATMTRQIDIGGGVPNRPRVSVGPGSEPAPPCTGSGCDPDPDMGCKNMVVVITSDGTAYSDAPNTDCPTGVRLNSWRDSQ